MRRAGACLHGNELHMREHSLPKRLPFSHSTRQFAAREAFSSLEEFMLQLQQEFLTNSRLETKQSVQLFHRSLLQPFRKPLN